MVTKNKDVSSFLWNVRDEEDQWGGANNTKYTMDYTFIKTA